MDLLFVVGRSSHLVSATGKDGKQIQARWQREYVPQVNSNDEVPFLLGHSLEGLVAQDTSISNKHMDTPELLHSDLHNLVCLFDRAGGSSSLSSS